MKEITFSQAIYGCLLYAESRRLSEHMVAGYCNALRRFQEFLEPEDSPLD